MPSLMWGQRLDKVVCVDLVIVKAGSGLLPILKLHGKWVLAGEFLFGYARTCMYMHVVENMHACIVSCSRHGTSFMGQGVTCLF